MTPVVIVVLILLGYIPIGLGGYCFGWWWRGRHSHSETTYRRTSRPMTAEEIKQFESAFGHFDRGFEAMKGMFR